MTPLVILLIDDTPDDRVLAIRAIRNELPQAAVAEVIDEANFAPFIESGAFQVAVTDYRLRWSDGIHILRRLKDAHPEKPVIMFTNSATEEVAVEAMKQGLDDYVLKSSKGYVGLAASIRQTMERYHDRRVLGRTQKELEDLNRRLEKMVEERTAKLEGLNDDLQRELAERKRIEALLVRSRDFYLTLLEEFPTLIWRAGTDAKCDYFNKAWLRFRGRTIQQEQGDGWAEGIHPEDLDECMKTYQDAFKARTAFTLEYRLKRYDGMYRWVVDSGAPFDGLDGKFAGFIGTCYDITDARQGKDELERQVSRRTRQLQELNGKLHEKIQELEAFEDAVIGRELKMMELKKELEKFRGEEGIGSQSA